MRCQLLIVTVCLLAAAPALAQQPDAPREPSASDSLFSESNRLKMYESSKLSYSKAALYSLALPGLGNYYAQDYFLGTTILTFLGFSALFVAYGLITDQTGFTVIGGAAAGVSYATAVTTSLLGVRGYNQALQRSLKVKPAVSWSFHF